MQFFKAVFMLLHPHLDAIEERLCSRSIHVLEGLLEVRSEHLSSEHHVGIESTSTVEILVEVSSNVDTNEALYCDEHTLTLERIGQAVILFSGIHNFTDTFPVTAVGEDCNLVSRLSLSFNSFHHILVHRIEVFKVEVDRVVTDVVNDTLVNTLTDEILQCFPYRRLEVEPDETRLLSIVHRTDGVVTVVIRVDASHDAATLRQVNITIVTVVGQLHDSVLNQFSTTVSFVDEQQDRFGLKHPFRRTEFSDQFTGDGLDLFRQAGYVTGISGVSRMPSNDAGKAPQGSKSVTHPFGLTTTVATSEHHRLVSGEVETGLSNFSESRHILLSFFEVRLNVPFRNNYNIKNLKV